MEVLLTAISTPNFWNISIFLGLLTLAMVLSTPKFLLANWHAIKLSWSLPVTAIKISHFCSSISESTSKSVPSPFITGIFSSFAILLQISSNGSIITILCLWKKALYKVISKFSSNYNNILLPPTRIIY